MGGAPFGQQVRRSHFLPPILSPPACVCVALPQGKIEFGVINQSVSAFNHILTDVSLVVYQVREQACSSAGEGRWLMWAGSRLFRCGCSRAEGRHFKGGAESVHSCSSKPAGCVC